MDARKGICSFFVRTLSINAPSPIMLLPDRAIAVIEPLSEA
jgi:hypothetical protein